MLRRAATLTWVTLLVACHEPDPTAGATSGSSTSPSASAAASSAALTAPAQPQPDSGDLGDEAAWRRCRERAEAIRREPAAPGAPSFAEHRLQMVGRVRGAAVLWKREPRPPEESSAVTQAVRAIEESAKPLPKVRRLLRKHRERPVQLRAGLLREGYLYVRGVDAALAIVQQLALPQLFEEPEIFLLRDGMVHALRRQRIGKKVEYVHTAGPLAGSRAELLFADRVATDETGLTSSPLAIPFATARQAHGFDRLRPVHLTAEWLVADVRYGADLWVPAVFDVRGPSARLNCHALSAETAGRVRTARQAARRATRVQARIRQVVYEQVMEQLPFDAPRGGGGDQQDKYPLRARWQDAYEKGRRWFRFDDKRYDVYDERGRPLVPQVCIDFVYDTWERASGTWYQPMVRTGPGQTLTPAPGRTDGGLRIDELGIENRRRVSKFLQYAEAHPELFDLWKMPPEDRVLFTEHERFFDGLRRHADQFRVGDVLVVRRPKSGARALHHNLIVMATDPILGIPTLLAGNAARPRLQTFDGAMQITPRRYLEYRIRPRATWLDEAVLRAEQ